MSKAGKLAGLAALAGAAYEMTRDKEGSPKGKEDTGPGYKSTETRNDEGATADKKTKSDVLDAITAPKEKSNDAAGNQGVLSSKSTKPASTSKPAASTSKPTTSTSDQRNLESGTSRGTRPAEAKNPNFSNEGRNSTAPSIKSKVVDATKRAGLTAVKAATQGPIASATNSSNRVPTSEEAAANRQAAYDKVKSVGSSVVDYVKNFETPAERRAREAKNPSPKTSSTRDYNEDALSSGSAMRRGGAVKKMASGGMTASRRADGIATKGKTRGKMC